MESLEKRLTVPKWQYYKMGAFFEIIIFELKNDGKKWSRIYFETHRAPSEIPAKLPRQFGHSGQIFLHWAKQL